MTEQPPESAGQVPAASGQPPIGWAPPTAPPAAPSMGEYEGGRPPLTIGALLSDTFARYGADPIRLILLSVVASVLSLSSSYLTNPFAPPQLIALGGLLSIVGLVVGVVVGSATLALLEGGRRMPFGGVLRRGVERAGWMFLTALLLGLGAFVVLLVPLVVILISFLFGGVAVGAILLFAVLLVLFFLAARLTLALVANVADSLNTIDALKVSWRVTAPVGIWLRILAAELLLGLLIAPASLGGALLLLPGMFGRPLLLVAAALLLAILAPLYSILLYAAYRRLVAPIPPSWTAPSSLPPASVSPPTPPQPDAPLVPWTEPGAPAAQPPFGHPAAPPPTPRFDAPQLGFGGSALLVLVLGLGVGSVVSVGYVVSEFMAGRIQMPSIPGFPGSFPRPSNFPFPGLQGFDGEVAPGTVAFGTSSDLSTCTVDGQTVFVPASGQVVWVAAFTRRTTLADDIRLRVRLDGQVIVDAEQNRGVFDCLGTDEPETGLTPGLYEFEVLLNGVVDARGSLIAS